LASCFRENELPFNLDRVPINRENGRHVVVANNLMATGNPRDEDRKAFSRFSCREQGQVGALKLAHDFASRVRHYVCRYYSESEVERAK
jgi:hypothetical protein